MNLKIANLIGEFLEIFLCLALGFVIGVALCHHAIYNEVEAVRNQAIERGHARYFINKDGLQEFEWKN